MDAVQIIDDLIHQANVARMQELTAPTLRQQRAAKAAADRAMARLKDMADGVDVRHLGKAGKP